MGCKHSEISTLRKTTAPLVTSQPDSSGLQNSAKEEGCSAKHWPGASLQVQVGKPVDTSWALPCFSNINNIQQY